MERLTEKELYDGEICFTRCQKTNCPDKCASCEIPRDAIKKLKAYEDAEEQGLLQKLPCKVGDTLYILTNDSPNGIEESVCSRIVLGKKGLRIQAPCIYDDWGNAKWNFKKTDFGKTVFLTRAEAETALKISSESEA